MMLVCFNLFYCTWRLYLHTEAHASSPDVRQVIWFSLPYGGISVSDKPSSVCAVPAYGASAPFSCRKSCFGNFMLKLLGDRAGLLKCTSSAAEGC
jgi:hypothetical protein